MPIKNPFHKTIRDDYGIHCYYCKHFIKPKSWPDVEKKSACSKHKVYLSICLRESGYCDGAWLCKDFINNYVDSAFPGAVKVFEENKNQLEDGILYNLYGVNGFLEEYKINDLNRIL